MVDGMSLLVWHQLGQDLATVSQELHRDLAVDQQLSVDREGLQIKNTEDSIVTCRFLPVHLRIPTSAGLSNKTRIMADSSKIPIMAD